MSNPVDGRAIVIVVDDELLSLASAKVCLSDDYWVFTVASGSELFKLLSRITPNIILLDIKMPEEDGYSILSELKTSVTTSEIPIIFVTGNTDSEEEAMGLAMGASDYVTKPFSNVLLKRRVKMHLELQSQKLKLKEAVRKSDEASNAKSAFIANMSHEMRTPLNAILGLTELILDESSLSDRATSNLLKIERAGNTLLNIVCDILDISKIEMGKFELTPIEYDVPPRINDTVNQCIVFRGEKAIDFELKIGENFPAKLYGDDLRLKQIYSNLLSNAFKYTHTGKVTFELQCVRDGKDAHVIATVSDTGVGIPDEYLMNVFDDYFQVETSANRKIIGTGLGLSITRNLVQQMGGEISVQSEVGKGSTFTVSLIQDIVSDDVIDATTIESLKDNTYYPEDKHRYRKDKLLSMPYATILVVDDVETNHDVASGILLRYNVRTLCVHDGPSAIELVRKAAASEDEQYTAIFMDHMMPGMDGIEATKHIREISSEYAKNVPIIAFTANALTGSEEMFLKSGFQDFISKPLDLKQFDRVLTKWLYNDELYQRCKLCQDKDNKKPMCKRKCAKFPTSPPVSDVPGSAFSDFSISGIDYRHGLDRFGGNEDSYLSVLRTFSKNSPVVLENARVVNSDNLADYIVAVHGLKGACYGICAEDVGDLAKALEVAGKSGDFGFIAENNDTFLARISSLISEIDAFLSSLKDSSPKELRDAPDDASLQLVLEACRRNNMSAVDDAVAELEKFEYSSNGELVAWLRDMADEMNYSDMVERLESI